MSPALRPAPIALVLAGLLPTTGAAQLPELRPSPEPPYTAFPDLALRAPLGLDGASRKAYESALCARLTAGYPWAPRADANTLERVHTARLNEAIAYSLTIRDISVGLCDTDEERRLDFCRQIVDAGAGRERTAAGRVRWYELGVELRNGQEIEAGARAHAGQLPLHLLERARVLRLEAEADLIHAMRAAAKEAREVPPPNPREAIRADTVVPHAPIPQRGPGTGDPRKPHALHPFCPAVEGPTTERTGADGRKYSLLDAPALLAPYLAATAAWDAPPLDWLRASAVREAAGYVAASWRLRAADHGGAPIPERYSDACRTLARLVADREGLNAGRVRGFEAAVLLMRDWEQFAEASVSAGKEPTAHLHAARVARLRAEADLIRTASEPRFGRDPRRGPAPGPSGGSLDPRYTAFPDIKPPPFPASNGERDAYEKSLLSPLLKGYPWEPAKDASPLDRVRAAQLREAAAVVLITRELLRVGRCDSSRFADYADACRLVAHEAARRDTTAEARTRRRETPVAVLKDLERLTEARVEAKAAALQQLNLARSLRLRAEIELLEATAAK